ncbi:MAG: tetratricopeptide repeat protein [Gemmatales bacterium]
MKSLLAVVIVVALANPHYAQVVEKPDTALERDWQEYVTLLRTEESTSSFFAKHAMERIKAWREAADKGDAHGQVLYARCLIQGTGVAKDVDQAHLLFETAAKKGEPIAMFNLGISCAKQQDWKHCNEWLHKSAERGESAAMSRLSSNYYEGNGVPVDKLEAVKWAKAAAEKNDPMGMCLLAISFELGSGVEKDLKAAATWYKRSCRKRTTKSHGWPGNDVRGW